MKAWLAVIGAAILVGIFLSASLPLPTSRERGDAAARAITAAGDRRETAPPPQARSSPEAPQLFPPEDLPLLEGPDRVLWQKPELVMDLLNIGEGSTVADIGAGAGWFTIRLARRVGPRGTVYAQDLQREMVIAINRRVKRETPPLRNVTVVQGEEDSLHLPQHTLHALDAVLVVDVYPEVKDGVKFLRSLAASLKPNGRIGIVNYEPGSGGPGPEPDERVASAVVEQDARTARLRVLSTTNLRYQYLVVIGLQR